METEELTTYLQDKSFILPLLVFERDTNGRPLYHHGLQDIAYVYYVSVTGPVLKISKEQNDILHAYLEDYFEQLRDKFLGTVLLDNDDAFFKNMIPPHNHDTFMAMFEKRNLYYTPDISPPPMRLNFPFLVGKNEKNLRTDLHEYITQHINSDLTTTQFEFLHSQPFTTVTVKTPED